MAEEKKNDTQLEPFKKYIRFKERPQERSLSCITCKEVETTLEGEIYPLHVIIKGRNAQYEFKKVKNCAELTDFLHRCEILDDADVYVITSKKRLDIETLLHLLNKQYREYYDDLHAVPYADFFEKILKTLFVVLLTIVPLLILVWVKKKWADCGLPLEAYPVSSVESLMSILVLLFASITFKVAIALIAFFALFHFFIDFSFLYPKFGKGFWFYIKRFLISLVSAIILVYSVLSGSIFYEFVSKEKTNIIIQVIFDNSLYPKIFKQNNNEFLLSHRDGKYVYIHDVDLNTSKDLNCSQSYSVLQHMNLKAPEFVAIEYESLKVKQSDFISLKDYCILQKDKNVTK